MICFNIYWIDMATVYSTTYQNLTHTFSHLDATTDNLCIVYSWITNFLKTGSRNYFAKILVPIAVFNLVHSGLTFRRKIYCIMHVLNILDGSVQGCGRIQELACTREALIETSPGTYFASWFHNKEAPNTSPESRAMYLPKTDIVVRYNSPSRS
jgi:hypothetical protein